MASAMLLSALSLLTVCAAVQDTPSLSLTVTEGEGSLFSSGLDAIDVWQRQTLLAEFGSFKQQYGKKYPTAAEETARMQVFADNWRMIVAHNAADKPYQLGINEFVDMTWEEFKQSRLTEMQNCSAQRGSPRILLRGSVALPPAKMDWREKGIVSPVKNQGHCGSCWTFSTTGALEAAFTQKHGKPANLSEQQLVDCAGGFNNMGCGGGLPSQAYEYVLYNGGIDTEDAYPYVGVNGDCHFSEDGVGAKVIDVFNVTQGDEDELRGAVGFARPTSVAFEVVGDFRFYKTGVYQSDECRKGADTVNHAVLAVGYDISVDTPHWVIKNSWGAGWGDEGYFKLKLGENMCGIAECASYPVVA